MLGKPEGFVSKCETGERRVDVVELPRVVEALTAPLYDSSVVAQVSYQAEFFWRMAGARRAERAQYYESASFIGLQNRLAANLRRVRDRGGWTQEETAHRVGLSTRVLQRIESAETNVTLVTLARLCAGLDVDVAVLLGPGPTGGRRSRSKKR